MSQQTDDFILFDEVVTHKKYPRYVSMQKTCSDTPPNSCIEKGSVAVRAWFNAKNLRKRVK